MPAYFRDIVLVVGLGLILLVAAMLWAKFVRKRRIRNPDGTARYNVLSEDGAEPGGRKRKHRHRRRRRDHRSRNPTLSETGGLPSPRGPGEIPPAL